MRLWLWAQLWVWLAGLRVFEAAPSVRGTESLVPGAEALASAEQPEFFDYPDSDQVRLLAVARFIGEKPVIFADSGFEVFNHILVCALVLALLFILFQFCTHLTFQKGA